MPKPTPLAIELPRIDGDTQSRLQINEDTVEEYAELIEQNGKTWPFPPIDVFYDGSDYFVADGFHRLLAGLRAKRGSVPCIVHKGTARDARIFAMTANDRHGLRMTRADKRACVEWLLDQPGKMLQKEIAEKAGVARRTVAQIVADRKYDHGTDVQTSQRFGGGDNTPDSPHGDPDSEPPSEPESPPKGRQTPPQEPVDYGKCPACAGTKWTEVPSGADCSKCGHPHGEPAGETDEDRLKTQRQKTQKTAEALLRAFDDLQAMQARPEYDEAIKRTKQLLAIAKGWV